VKEKEQTIKNIQEDMHRKLYDKEEEMKLGMEERDLQKMAALSQQDNLKDHLQENIKQLMAVSLKPY